MELLDFIDSCGCMIFVISPSPRGSADTLFNSGSILKRLKRVVRLRERRGTQPSKGSIAVVKVEVKLREFQRCI